MVHATIPKGNMGYDQYTVPGILKTNFVLFHSKRLKPYKSLNLKMDGVFIQEVSTVKYLGVTFNSNLAFKNHVNELC